MQCALNPACQSVHLFGFEGHAMANSYTFYRMAWDGSGKPERIRTSTRERKRAKRAARHHLALTREYQRLGLLKEVRNG